MMLRTFLHRIIATLSCFVTKTRLKGKVSFGKGTKVGRYVSFEGGNVLWNNVHLGGRSSIGYGTFIAPQTSCFDVSIGRYCCIGSNVKIVIGRHPSKNYVSVHPAFYSLLKQSGFTYVDCQKFDENSFADRKNGVRVKIGNDVWIGSNVVIMEGVTIGDGAIVGACSLVNKDVPPYSIVGGVPANVIRYRFTEEEIMFLSNFKWWDKNEAWIKTHANSFEDIQRFIKEVSNE